MGGRYFDLGVKESVTVIPRTRRCRARTTPRTREARHRAEPAGQLGSVRRPGLQQAVLLQDFVSVVLVDQHRRQRDDRLELLAVQQLDGLAQAFGAWRRIEERRRELALVDPGHAFVRQAVDADDELDVLVAAGVLGGEIGAVGHRIVVAIDQVDLLVVAQRGRHDVVGLVLLPVARLVVEQVLDARLLVGEGVEAVVAVMRGLRAHAAPDFDDVALQPCRGRRAA